MDEEERAQSAWRRAPVHLWVVGLLLVLWNAWGLAAAIAAQSGRLASEASPEAAAYFASQPLWFVVLADIGPLAGVAGAVALLLQHKSAVRLFTVQLVVIAAANLYEVAVGTSLLLSEQRALVATAILLPLLAAQIVYARWLAKRGVLY